jgi:hypothetical protein
LSVALLKDNADNNKAPERKRKTGGQATYEKERCKKIKCALLRIIVVSDNYSLMLRYRLQRKMQQSGLFIQKTA